MTQFFISPGFATNAREISLEQYTQLSEAIDRTKTLFRIEGHFQILAQEYFDFEELISRLALRATYKISEDRLNTFFDAASAETSAKLMAFFSVSRSYEEQTRQRLRDQQDTGCSAQEFAAYLSQEYDRFLEYRIAYSLRNYLTHESLLGITISVSRKTEPDLQPPEFEGPSRSRRLVSATLRSSDFVNATKIKKTVRDEVAALNCEHLDLLWLVRNYVSSVATAHSKLREETEDQVVDDLSFLRKHGLMLLEEDLSIDSAARLSVGKPKLDPSERYFSEEFLRALVSRRSGWKALRGARRNYFTSEITARHRTFPVSSAEVHVPKA